ncbi:gem-associated protein 7-like isoform X2 [Diaphorina citri]|uniref:Gem-associated protein 7-like isoform X2 n=1 Tax=Diaphorina citri TaxID=121845 RepID=A0A1S3DNJ1_DIACI|nr:gem-associated protein 7-like isoform X2 [Diaphorina citri]
MDVDRTSSRSDEEIAAEMREKFLKTMSSLSGQPCTINMFERTVVTAEFQGTNSDLTEFYVRNLKTPIGTFHEHALLRVDDIVDIEI